LLLRARGPHAGEAIGLQLEPHAERIGLRFARPLSLLVDPGQDPQEILNVVTHFMADDIRMRELARRTELPRHHVEEAQIQIHDAIFTAIERAGRRLSQTACRRIAVAKQAQLGIHVGLPAFLEGGSPYGLRAAQNLRHEFHLRIVGRGCVHRLIGGRLYRR